MNLYKNISSNYSTRLIMSIYLVCGNHFNPAMPKFEVCLGLEILTLQLQSIQVVGVKFPAKGACLKSYSLLVALTGKQTEVSR